MEVKAVKVLDFQMCKNKATCLQLVSHAGREIFVKMLNKFYNIEEWKMDDNLITLIL
jgi:hypothetical protein